MTPLEPPFLPGNAVSSQFGEHVVLTATVTVHGEEITAQQYIDPDAWRHIDQHPQLRAGYEQNLRHRLAAAMVDRLEPTITVREPARADEAVTDALARADAVMRNEPEPERCRSVELSSEA